VQSAASLTFTAKFAVVATITHSLSSHLHLIPRLGRPPLCDLRPVWNFFVLLLRNESTESRRAPLHLYLYMNRCI
jgi:hypothetical protein